MPVEPLFPFGFGLSYTTFSYSQLEVQPKVISPGGKVRILAMVTNTGRVGGEEIVQCYVQDCISTLTRPVRELKGFKRISLQPAESKIVEFELGPVELSYYGPGGKWILEPGKFLVWVGGDSGAALEGTFEIQPG